VYLLTRIEKEVWWACCLPFGTPPPNPLILLSLAEPPALILASRRSLRMRACSAALEGGELAGALGEEDTMGVSGVVSAILILLELEHWVSDL
jgi:hypothetical protein